MNQYKINVYKITQGNSFALITNQVTHLFISFNTQCTFTKILLNTLYDHNIPSIIVILFVKTQI